MKKLLLLTTVFIAENCFCMDSHVDNNEEGRSQSGSFFSQNEDEYKYPKNTEEEYTVNKGLKENEQEQLDNIAKKLEEDERAQAELRQAAQRQAELRQAEQRKAELRQAELRQAEQRKVEEIAEAAQMNPQMYLELAKEYLINTAPTVRQKTVIAARLNARTDDYAIINEARAAGYGSY